MPQRRNYNVQEEDIALSYIWLVDINHVVTRLHRQKQVGDEDPLRHTGKDDAHGARLTCADHPRLLYFALVCKRSRNDPALWVESEASTISI